MENLKNILVDSRELKNELINMRRTIHENPEVGRDLPKTREFIMEKLKEFGYEPELVAGMGVIAYAGRKKPGKTFLLRADMDALPIKEEADNNFKSDNGNMHACGHDMHSAMLLGAAKILKKYEDQIDGTIKLLFQPDEEGFTGAKSMIEAGVLENPKVDAAMALHVYSNMPSDVIVYGIGTSISSCIKFRITAKGVGCHGAMPERGVDPINIAAHIYLAIQEITTREIEATEPVVMTIGKFVGGKTPNVIPEDVVMEGTIRALSENAGRTAFERMKEISENIARAFRGSATVEELASAPPLTNDKELSDELSGYAKELFGDEEKVLGIKGGGMGSEDFAAIASKVPSVYFILGAGTKEENPNYGYPMHHQCVQFNEDILVKGVAMLSYASIKWLKDNSTNYKIDYTINEI